MTGPAAAAAARALRYDAWFDGPWGRYAWRVETAAVLAALGPLAGRRVADIGCGTGRLLGSLSSHGAQAVGIDTDPAMLALASTRGRVLTEMARITRPGGRLVAAVLNPGSLWGILDQPARRAPYARGCFLPRSDLLALGRRHGQPSVHGALFAARRLPARQVLGPALETAGRITPRFGACQVLTVITRT